MPNLAEIIAKAIDDYMDEHPDLMVSDVLGALEHVKYEVVDSWIIGTDKP